MTSFFPVRLVQPDRRTCGPSVLVALRILESPAFAKTVVRGSEEAAQARFAAQARATHRVTNRVVDRAGRVQLPWTLTLGTAPWGMARQIDGRVRYVLPHRRAQAFDWLTDSLARGPTPVYVGNRWAPRHVVLAVHTHDETVTCYDPASGDRTRFTREEWLRRDLHGCGGWSVPWAVIGRW